MSGPVVSKIEVTIKTGDIANAGTDGRIYLGIGGREYRLDSNKDDFEKGSERKYIIGNEDNVSNDDKDKIVLNNNKMREHSRSISGSRLIEYPKYIRFEKSGDKHAWFMESTIVEVLLVGLPGTQDITNKYDSLYSLWMGDKYGKICYLELDTGLDPILRRGLLYRFLKLFFPKYIRN